MTYEHARQMVNEMNRKGITGICEPVSIDCILQRHSVPEELYYRFSEGFHNPDPAFLLDSYDLLASLVFPGQEDYFGELGSYVQYTITDEEALDPFSEEGKDNLSTPHPSHDVLKIHMDELEESIASANFNIPEEDKKELRATYRRKLMLAIVIDNALTEGLTVLGVTKKHVFGIMKGTKNGEYFMINSFRKDTNKNHTTLYRYGPLTLPQVVGVEGYEPESPMADYFPDFEDEKHMGVSCSMLILYPPEDN